MALYLSVFGGSLWAMQVWMGLGMTGAAFVGAVLAVLLPLAFARGVPQHTPLLLAGVVVGGVLGSLLVLPSPPQPPVL